MTRKIRTANPMFQKPLTTAEADKKGLTPTKLNYITCSKCGLSGGTLVRVGEDTYECQDKAKCRMLQLRRR